MDYNAFIYTTYPTPFVQLSTVDHYQTSPMELWTHQVEQTTSVQQSIHVTQDMFSMEISREHVKRMEFGVGVNQLVMVCRTIYIVYIIISNWIV